MAPTIFGVLGSIRSSRSTADADIFSAGPLQARSILLARDGSSGAYTPGSGALSPGSINNNAVFALFGIIGVAFVVTAIWFCFWAKNGGFHFRKNDWDDYKSTVLRRRGPNGTILSGATPSTQLGGGSIYKDINDGTTELGSRGDDDMTVVSGTTGLTGITGGVSDFAGREKRRRKREQRERERERRREGKEAEKKAKKQSKSGRRVGADGILIDEEAEAEAKKHLRSYRHEKPARIGGINKQSEGSSWDGSTNPSHSTASGSGAGGAGSAGSAVAASTVETGTTVTSELMAHREHTPTTTPTTTPTKKDRERPAAYTSASGGIRKVYSTADKNASRENERIRAEARRLQEKGRAASRRDFSWQRADDASDLHRPDRDGGESSSRVSRSNRTESEVGTGSEVGTKVYHHSVHIPGTSSSDFAYQDDKRKKRASQGGYRRGQDDL